MTWDRGLTYPILGSWKPAFVDMKKNVNFIKKKLFESFKMSTHMIYLHDSHKIPALWLATMFWEPIREKYFVAIM